MAPSNLTTTLVKAPALTFHSDPLHCQHEPCAVTSESWLGLRPQVASPRPTTGRVFLARILPGVPWITLKEKEPSRSLEFPGEAAALAAAKCAASKA